MIINNTVNIINKQFTFKIMLLSFLIIAVCSLFATSALQIPNTLIRTLSSSPAPTNIIGTLSRTLSSSPAPPNIIGTLSPFVFQPPQQNMWMQMQMHWASKNNLPAVPPVLPRVLSDRDLELKRTDSNVLKVLSDSDRDLERTDDRYQDNSLPMVLERVKTSFNTEPYDHLKSSIKTNHKTNPNPNPKRVSYGADMTKIEFEIDDGHVIKPVDYSKSNTIQLGENHKTLPPNFPLYNYREAVKTDDIRDYLNDMWKENGYV